MDLKIVILSTNRYPVMYKWAQIHSNWAVRISGQDRMGIYCHVLKLRGLNMEMDLKNILLIIDRSPVMYKTEQIDSGQAVRFSNTVSNLVICESVRIQIAGDFR